MLVLCKEIGNLGFRLNIWEQKVAKFSNILLLSFLFLSQKFKFNMQANFAKNFHKSVKLNLKYELIP